MTDIVSAYEARIGLIGDVLKAVFGPGDAKSKPAIGKVDFKALPKFDDVSPEAFDAMFG
ncbi:hypothetical protein ACUSIJ_25005 [Pseudochelatococcus sp. B33]